MSKPKKLIKKSKTENPKVVIKDEEHSSKHEDNDINSPMKFITEVDAIFEWKEEGASDKSISAQEGFKSDLSSVRSQSSQDAKPPNKSAKKVCNVIWYINLDLKKTQAEESC